jgi:hypothetical protein
MKPSPFHTHPHAPRSERTSSPHPAATELTINKFDGTSTAVETAASDAHHDAIVRHIANRESDVERQSLPQYTPDNDPYRLATGLKPESELALIRANTSRKRDGCGPITLNKDAYRARKLEKFYEAQNENIERLLKPVDDHRREAKEEEGANHLKYRIAVVGSFVANVLLAILQLYAAASSKSLALYDYGRFAI